MENSTYSKKTGTRVKTKYSDVVWNNGNSRLDRINFVKKLMATKKKFLKEKVYLDCDSQGDAYDPLNVARVLEENGDEGHA